MEGGIYTHIQHLFSKTIIFLSSNSTLVFLIQLMSNAWDNILVGVSEHDSINVYWYELGTPISQHSGRYFWAKDQNTEINNTSLEYDLNSWLTASPMPSTLLFIGDF